MKATNNQLNLGLSATTATIITTRKSNEKYYSNKRFKKELDTYIADNYGDMELLNLLDNLEDTCSQYYNKYQQLSNLPHIDKKPETVGMDKVHRALAYAPYNNYKDIEKLKVALGIIAYLQENIDLKGFKALNRGLLLAQIRSIRTINKGSFIANSVLNVFTSIMGSGIDEISILGSGQVMEILCDVDFISKQKTPTKDNKMTYMVKTKYEDIADLFISFMETRKESVRFVCPADITKDSYILGSNAKHYTNVDNSPALIYAINKLNQTPISFADWVRVEDVERAVLNKLTKDGEEPIKDWMNVEAQYAMTEFLSVKESGNKFYIEHFIDGVNRIYEYKSYFGFQEGSAFRKMLRFYNKKSVNDKGVVAYKGAAMEMYGTDIPASIFAIDANDSWGYASAISNPTEPTGSIVYQDATSQGTGIYGLITGDMNLLDLGGFSLKNEAEWEKAYVKLSNKMNEEISVYYTERLGQAIYLDCFNTLNLKSILMTKLYNVTNERILSGKGYTPEVDEEEITLSSVEANSEFIRTKNVDGKSLVPLLQTVRDAGLDITSEDLLSLFNKAVNSVVPAALKAMAKINVVVRDKKDETMFQWFSSDGTLNRYAQTETKKVVIHWVSVKAHRHQLTHHLNVLSPLAAWRGVSPRKIQGFDSQLVRYVLNVMDSDLATIHDSIGSHGNDAEETVDTYIDGGLRIFDNDEGTKILTQIHGKDVGSLQGNISEEEREIIRYVIKNGKYSIMFA